MIDIARSQLAAMALDTKRAYKLQEFVAHSSDVNCLKIGRKTSRVLLTGGEDHSVNLWAIGKPNSILSLSGHTSGSKANNIGRLSVVQNSENELKPSLGRVSVSQNSDSAPKEIKPVASSGLVPTPNHS